MMMSHVPCRLHSKLQYGMPSPLSGGGGFTVTGDPASGAPKVTV